MSEPLLLTCRECGSTPLNYTDAMGFHIVRECCPAGVDVFLLDRQMTIGLRFIPHDETLEGPAAAMVVR